MSEGGIPLPVDAVSTLVLLDVDNTLYVEADAGIEAQIIQNTHDFCRNALDMSASQADSLYHEYGSTIEGLRQTVWKNDDDEKLRQSLQDFYETVYRDIDMSRLLLTSETPASGSTGYSHSQQNRKRICQLLQHCPYPIALASNSPSWHVHKVLRCMGLDCVNFIEVLTPDRLTDFPTKHEPIAFFKDSNVLKNKYRRILFLDDSPTNLHQVSSNLENVVPIHVNSQSGTLSDALMRHFGLVDLDYVFDSVEYLESKNIVDSQAMHPEIWNQMITCLREKVQKQGYLEIVDVGAGRLSILSLLLRGESSRGLSALFDNPRSDQPISYTAYESNEELLPACEVQLRSFGFQLVNSVPGELYLYSKDNWTIRLVLRRFDEANHELASPDLIVGCCFADLVDPNVLVPSLLRTFRLLDDASKGALIYFPITFAGCTQFLPPRPFQPSEYHTNQMIPSDTLAFQIYSKALIETMGHNLDPYLIVTSMERHGAKLLKRGTSNWKIDPAVVPYLFDTMLYFFGTTAGPPLLEAGFDSPGWIRRAKKERPKIQVSNVDLLFEIGGERPKVVDPITKSEPTTLQEIQFTAPSVVTAVEKNVPELGPDEVLSKCSWFLVV